MSWIREVVVAAVLGCSCTSGSGADAGGAGSSTSASSTTEADETGSGSGSTSGDSSVTTATDAPQTSTGQGPDEASEGEGQTSNAATTTTTTTAGASGSDDETSDATIGPEPSGTEDTTASGPPTHAELTSLPTVRQEHGAAALGGEVYVLGGFTPDVSTSVQVYSPQTDTWRDAADFPVPFHHPNVAVVGGLLYVAGFHFGPGLRTADPRTFAYDPMADAWTEREPLPSGTERGSSCVAVIDTKIYLFGGASDMTLATAHAYDTAENGWASLPPLPEPREHCFAAGIDGRAYIVSGRANGIQGLELESWVFDPEAETYDERAPILTPRGGAAGGVLDGRIYIFGGEGNRSDVDGIFHEVEAYDPISDRWEALPDMLIPRHGYGAAVVDERIYLPGGATFEGFGATDHHTVFSFGLDP